MPGPLPPDAQAVHRRTDTLARDLDPVDPLQVMDEQRRGPHRGMIARLARVLIDNRLDQRVDDPQGCGWATGSRGIQEPGPEIEPLTLLESVGPVVNRLTADLEQFGNLFDRLPIGEPEQGLCPASLLGQWGMGHEVFQLSAESIAQDDQGHWATSGYW
jgi:hypothetical protein